MKNFKKELLMIFYLFGFITALYSQVAVPATGGNAIGSTGTISYTVGQVSYLTITSAGGTSTQGVQQPYEIAENGIEQAEGISLECSVSPNPTTDFWKLKVENYKIRNLSFQLYDMNGKFLKYGEIRSSETSIMTGNILPGEYFLKVNDNQKEIKSFKIIKN